MKHVSCENEDVVQIMATGTRFFDAVSAQLEEQGMGNHERILIKDYIDDMPLYMAAADLVISRAGAMTLTELAMMRKCAILIPSPNVTDNHQYKNAKVLADAEAAILIEEKNMAENTVGAAVKDLLLDRELRERMSEQIAAFAREDAGKRIYAEIGALTRRKQVIVAKNEE